MLHLSLSVVLFSLVITRVIVVILVSYCDDYVGALLPVSAELVLVDVFVLGLSPSGLLDCIMLGLSVIRTRLTAGSVESRTLSRGRTTWTLTSCTVNNRSKQTGFA